MVLACVIAAVAILLDQLTKIWIVGLTGGIEGASLPVLPGVLDFTYVKNTGAAFGIFSGATWVLTVLTVIALAVLVFWVLKNKHKSLFFFISAGMVLGGALGNMIDRVFLGFVRDFIHFNLPFAVFNVADAFVVVGAILLCIYILFMDPEMKKKEQDEPAV